MLAALANKKYAGGSLSCRFVAAGLRVNISPVGAVT
jgi:hypothetical protein